MAEGTVLGLESNKNYCFRTIQKDSVNKTEIVSNEVCSISLKATLLSDKAVKCEWDKINNDELRRTAIFIMDGAFMNSVSVSLSDTTFIFDQLNCSSKYKFNLELTFKNSNNDLRKSTLVKSSQILVDPKSVKLLPALSSFGIVSTNGDNRINYNIFTNPYIPKFEIYRSVNGGEMIKVSEDSGNSYADTTVDVGKNNYCYAHKYVNGCGNESELSAKSCNVVLSSKTYGRLNWTPFTIQADSSIYKSGQVEYNVQLIDTIGNVVNILDNTKDTTMVIDIERFSDNLLSYKFRVLVRKYGKMNFQSQIIDFPIFSYSNSASLYLILGSESSKTHLTVYPNPAEDKIQIKSSGAPIRFVELIDVKGRVIHKGEILGDTFNLSEFEKGKYILRLYDTNKRLLNTKNIVKW